MYLHKISIDKDALRRDRKVYYDTYLLHKKIWALVSRDKNQQRNFLYRVEYDAYQNIEYIYLLALQRVTSQNDLKIAVSPLYRPQLKAGERLYFKLRANPIVKRRKNGKPKEYGLIIDAKHQFKKSGQHYQEEFSLDELTHEVGMKWLDRKGEQHGFSVKNFEVAINNDREFSIVSQDKEAFVIRTLDFAGILTVVNSDLSVEALYNGIGSAKAFGCGLMLVKRI